MRHSTVYHQAIRSLRLLAAADAAANGLGRSLRIISQIRTRHVARELAMLPLVAGMLVALPRLHPVFSWSIRHKLPLDDATSPSAKHPLQYGSTDITRIIVVAILQPYAAADREERWFRQNVSGWQSIVGRNALFAAAHMPAGQRLDGAVVLFISGLLLSRLHAKHGFEEAVVQHATHNLLVAFGVLGITCAGKMARTVCAGTAVPHVSGRIASE